MRRPVLAHKPTKLRVDKTTIQILGRLHGDHKNGKEILLRREICSTSGLLDDNFENGVSN